MALTDSNSNSKRIAILATGNEIINGDILDINTPFIAKELFQQKFMPGHQMTVPDNQLEIQNAIEDLLADHTGLIMTGGLGPTSDDLTRFALAEVIHKELIFDEASWQHIVDRLSRFNLPIPETNRQQCLFPSGAEILKNERGTAAGCFITHQGKPVFMLPGPPRENQPMFHEFVLPRLLKTDLQQNFYHQSWLLLGIGEGHIAEKINELTEQQDCEIGYRADIPYLELKLTTFNGQLFQSLKAKITPLIKPYLVSENRQLASELLRQYIANYSKPILICDNATCGLLQSTLTSPSTKSHLTFTTQADQVEQTASSRAGLFIQIDGLDAYWQQKSDKMTQFSIKLFHENQHHEIIKEIPLRGRLSLTVANEMICWEIHKLVTRNEQSE